MAKPQAFIGGWEPRVHTGTDIPALITKSSSWLKYRGDVLVGAVPTRLSHHQEKRGMRALGARVYGGVIELHVINAAGNVDATAHLDLETIDAAIELLKQARSVANSQAIAKEIFGE